MVKIDGLSLQDVELVEATLDELEISEDDWSKLTSDELENALKEMKKAKVPKGDIKKMKKAAKLNKDEKVSFDNPIVMAEDDEDEAEQAKTTTTKPKPKKKLTAEDLYWEDADVLDNPGAHMVEEDLNHLMNDLNDMSFDPVPELQGRALGLLGVDNPLRKLLHNFISRQAVDTFLLILIFLNLITLAMQSPGSGMDDLQAQLEAALNRTAELARLARNASGAAPAAGAVEDPFTMNDGLAFFNNFCIMVFTIEAGIRIVALGFVKGEGTYLRNSWNVFDFVLISSIWAVYFIIATGIFDISENIAFTISVLRSVRAMRFFESIREIMSTVAQSIPMLGIVAGLMMYFYVIFGVVGMELFTGIMSRKCMTPAAAVGLELVECPPMLICEHQCYELVQTEEQYMSQNRLDHPDLMGFDNVFVAFMTEFGVMLLDNWSINMHPIRDSGASTASLAFPVFAMVVIIIALVTVNLFLAAITFTFLKIRRNNRREDLLEDFATNFDELVATATAAQNGEGEEEEVDYKFPMNKCCTPKAIEIARSAWFDTWTINVVVMNTVLMAMAHHNMETWLVVMTTFAEVAFTVIYTLEVSIKILADGFKVFWSSGMNRLDFSIVVMAIVGYIMMLLQIHETAEILLGFKLFRVLRVSRLVFRVEVVKDVVMLAFSSMKTVLSLVFFLFFSTTICAIVGLHLFWSCHEDGNAFAARTGFTSFSQAFLAVTIIMTGDNWSGVTLGYMDCAGWITALYFGLIFIFSNFFVMNLFVAVFLENFELKDEDKATRQIERYASELAKDVLPTDEDGNFNPTKATQLRVLQLSMFLDENTNKHVFKRIGAFSKFTQNAVVNAPTMTKEYVRTARKAPKAVAKARTRLRMKLDSDFAEEYIGDQRGLRQANLDEATRILDEATAEHEEAMDEIKKLQNESNFDGWLTLHTNRKAAANTQDMVFVQANAGHMRMKHKQSMVNRVFVQLDADGDGFIQREDFERVLAELGGEDFEVDDKIMRKTMEELGDDSVVEARFQEWWVEIQCMRYSGPGKLLMPMLNKLLSSEVILSELTGTLEDDGDMESEDMDGEDAEEDEESEEEEDDGGETEEDFINHEKALWADQGLHGDDCTVDHVLLLGCKIGNVSKTEGEFSFTVSEKRSGTVYEYHATHKDEAKLWVEHLHVNSDFTSKLTLFKEMQLETAADMIACEEHKAKMQAKLDKIIKLEDEGVQLFGGGVAKLKNAAAELAEQAEAKANELKDAAEGAAEEIKEKHRLAEEKRKRALALAEKKRKQAEANAATDPVKLQAAIKRLQGELDVSRKTGKVLHLQHKEVVDTITQLTDDCKLSGGLHNAQAIMRKRKFGKEKKHTCLVHVWMEAEKGRIIISERHADAALLEVFDRVSKGNVDQEINQKQFARVMDMLGTPVRGEELEASWEEIRTGNNTTYDRFERWYHKDNPSEHVAAEEDYLAVLHGVNLITQELDIIRLSKRQRKDYPSVFSLVLKDGAKEEDENVEHDYTFACDDEETKTKWLTCVRRNSKYEERYVKLAEDEGELAERLDAAKDEMEEKGESLEKAKAALVEAKRLQQEAEEAHRKWEEEGGEGEDPLAVLEEQRKKNESKKGEMSSELEAEIMEKMKTSRFKIDDISLYLFGPDHPFRKTCKLLVETEVNVPLKCMKGDQSLTLSLPNGMLIIVLMNAIIIGAEGPPGQKFDNEWMEPLLIAGDQFCFFAFLCECGVKIVAYGFIFTPNGYMLDGWNRLDFVVVIVSIMDLIVLLLGLDAGWTSAFKLLRILRPLKLLNMIPSMGIVLQSISSAAPAASGIVAVIMICFIIFGIFGVSTMKGRFYRCVDQNQVVQWDRNRMDCCGSLECFESAVIAGTQYKWSNPAFHFDDIGSGMITLFSVWTIGGWAEIMQSSCDLTEIDQAPVRNASSAMSIYYLLFVIFVGYMMRALFIAVLVDFFAQESGSALTTKTQKNWQQMQMVMMRMKPKKRAPKGRCMCLNNKQRMKCYEVVHDEKFLHLIDVSIVLGLLIMLMPLKLWPTYVSAWFMEANRAILILWTVEMVLKMIAQSLHIYLLKNRADFIIMCILWIVTVKSTIDTYWSDNVELREVMQYFDFLNALQFLRVLRMTQLLTRSKKLANLMTTVQISIPQAKNIMIILLLVFYIFGVLGMKIYGGRCTKPGAPAQGTHGFNYGNCLALNHSDNFDSIGSAMSLLFQICTGQDTSGIMDDLNQNTEGTMIFPYFLAFYMFANLILVNLFVAVLLENFEYNITDESFAITEEDVDDFKMQWDNYNHEGCDELLISVEDVDGFVRVLTGTFSMVREFDPHWYNRLVLELEHDSHRELDIDDTVTLHQLLHSMIVLRFGKGCQSYEEQKEMIQILDRQRERFAKKLLTCATLAWRQQRRPPPEYVTEKEKKRWRAAICTIRVLAIDLLVRQFKLSAPKEVEMSRIVVLGDRAKTEEDTVKQARTMAELARSVQSFQADEERDDDTESTAGLSIKNPIASVDG